jgi:transaldolase
MAIFLDTGKISEVEKYMRMGILRGVTTNPTILFKDGIKGGLRGVKERSIEIAKTIYPYPLSVEVTTNVKDRMIAQAREFAEWAENIDIKITIHGPAGEPENVEVIHELAAKHGRACQCHGSHERSAVSARRPRRGSLCIPLRGQGE